MGVSPKISELRTGSPALLAAILGIGLFGSSLTASAAVTTTWDLTSSTLCKQTSPSSAGTTCIGDGNSNATNGNVYQFTQAYGAAGTLTATAYHNSTTTTPVTSLGSASFLGQYAGTGYGLGVENLPAPQHAMDNNQGFDFIVFTLPGPASSVTISLSTFNSYENVNATVFTGNGALPTSLTSLPSGWSETTTSNPFKEGNGCDSTYQGSGYSLGSFGAACGEYNGYYTVTGNGTYTTNGSPAPQITDTPGGTFTEVIVAATLSPGGCGCSQEYDYFKVSSLSYTAGSSRVPEPTSMAILAASLVGLGFLQRRRRRPA
jgi:hypothetical protein